MKGNVKGSIVLKAGNESLNPRPESLFRKLFRFLASLKLALTLMGVIVAATAVGTICESSFNADVAREYIYNAPWFNIWLGVLCVNLFCAAAIRYPWKPHQTGFVITHAGIITLLIGSMIDRKWGIEGYVHLHRGAEATSTMELNKQELRVYVSDCDEYGVTTFQTKTMINERRRKFSAHAPIDDVKVDVLDVRSVVESMDVQAAKNGKPAARLTLSGAMMGRNEMSMFLGDEQAMGPAILRFVKGMPPESKPASPTESGELVPRRERYYVFAKSNEPMGKTLAGEPTGLKATLEHDAKDGAAKLSLKMLGKNAVFAVKENVGKEVEIAGLPDWKLNLIGYYPNFRIMENNQPGTADDKPDNPAVLFEVKGPLVKSDVDLSASAHTVKAHSGVHNDQVENTFSLYLGEDKKLRYHIKSKKTGEKSGEVALEQPIKLGWAPGAEATVQEYLESAAPVGVWRPTPGEFNTEATNPGLLCRVTAGGESRELWVGKRMADDPARTSLKFGKRTIELAFANCTEELPFSVSLLNFHAPRDEGMERSMSFTSFESTLGFDAATDTIQLVKDSTTAKQLKKELLEGGIVSIDKKELTFRPSTRGSEPLRIPLSDIRNYEKQSHKISMNNPTTYPVTWYGPWLGINYKFSQAGHNFPNDPDYSGVQVLRDPGWLAEWLGSLLICLGIFTMFYLKPYTRRAAAAVPAKSAVSFAEQKSLQASSGE